MPHISSLFFHLVYNCFAKLYKVILHSNTAFFTGNLSWAYHFLCDALLLFRKVGDEKAIGCACNNIGNTLFAMKVQGTKQPDDETDVGKGSVIKEANALVFYDEAIEIGQRELEEASGTESKADFAQRLGDRLFNRSLYLLHIQNDADAPTHARELALSDLTKVRDLDCDVREFWVDRQMLLLRSEEVFSRLIRRVHGLSEYYSEGESRCIPMSYTLVFESWCIHRRSVTGIMPRGDMLTPQKVLRSMSLS